MNYRLIIKLIGNVMKYEAFFMVPPLAVSFLYGGEDALAFIATMVILIVLGFALSYVKPKDKTFRTREGFVAVALSWIVLSVFGAVPFYVCGYFNSYIDCLFESISGFTTTGATILHEVESLPKGILFWRSFSQWIGGMGVLVFMLAIMPSMSASSVNLLKAESPGPSPSKFVPKIKETAKIMYIIYFVMTAANVILLKLAGLPLFDSFIHALSSAGTGGFSNMNASMGAYNNAWAEVISTVFMFLFGTNFALYFYLLKKDFKSFFKDEELRLYLVIVLTAVGIITINITGIYGSVLEALRHASFQVSAIITSTGYATADFNVWPSLSKAVIVLLMLTGACAGSTGGGIKLIRILTLFKAIRIEVNRLIHPRIIKIVKVNDKKVEDEILLKIFMFFFVYFSFLVVGTIIVSLDGYDMITNVTAMISALSNIGPGLGLIGPTGSFSGFSPVSKLVLSFCMLAGRLEFFPVLVLFLPSIWRKGSLS